MESYNLDTWKSNFLCQVCKDVAKNPVYCKEWFTSKSLKKVTFFCKSCYWFRGILAKNLQCEGWKTVNPCIGRTQQDDDETFNDHKMVGKVDEGLIPYLDEQQFECPNSCGVSDVGYTELCDHLNEGKWDGTEFSYQKIKEVQERFDTIKKQDKYFEPKDDKIKLRDSWGSDNAMCFIWFYLSSLDGYICYNCTRMSCKEHCEEYDRSIQYIYEDWYHPYGFLAWVSCLKYGMVKLDRIPYTYDQIFKFIIPKCNTPKCTTTNLLYQQMYQHERVWEGDLPKELDPVHVDLIPYFHKDGGSVSLLNSDTFRKFHKSPVPVERTVDLNISLGKGFKVCILRHTNQILVVGGKGSETKTLLYNPQSNQIEATQWDLKYPRSGHSLCSADNMMICTGSDVSDQYSKKVEVFR